MKLVKVGAAVLNQTPMDWVGNTERIQAVLLQARQQNISVLCLPELCISGYGCEDAFQSIDLQRMAWQGLQDIAPHTRDLVVSVGLPILFRNGLYNTACLLVDGRIVGFVAKRFLAGDGLHYEPRWFTPWPEGQAALLEVDSNHYPIGDLIFDCGGVRIGFEICEDAWVANRPGNALARQGVDIILNPSASHFAFGKSKVRHRFVLEGSRAFGVHYLYANLVGNEAGRAIYDGGALIASLGELQVEGPRFSFQDIGLESALVDLDANRMYQSRIASYHPTLTEDDRCIHTPFCYPEQKPKAKNLAVSPWPQEPFAKEEEFSRAVTLALFDYLRKSGAQGFVVSLSGGADSAAMVVLVALMVDRSIAELGLAKTCQRLCVPPTNTKAALLRQLLVCVYQATEQSSAATQSSARELATALGAEFLLWDVQPIVNLYQQQAHVDLGRKLDWAKDDIALQNIQARVRGPGAWLLANLRNALLLATSNRSEAAVGYATMDGDTCGGVSPIAGIDKSFLGQWLRWMEQQGPEGFSPMAALASVNALAPSAELRPKAAAQKDEDDLMPYTLLDAVERAAIRDKQSPLDVFLQMRVRFPHYTTDQMAIWVERFFLLWSRNQWKRERYAPSFHVDDANLDPKTWCRFPILSGGFRSELAQLRRFLKDNANNTC